MVIVKKLLLAFVVAVLAGCANGPKVDKSISAVAQDSRVRYLIIHYTAQDSATSLKTLTQQQVSAHYLQDDQGPEYKTWALVDESRRAYQAGVSSWKLDAGLNAASIGIEIVNLGYTDTPQGRVYYPFPQGQIDKLIALVKDIVKRHDIAPERVLGHSDIAPQRKPDPGPLFPWKQLADAGLVLWPDAREAARRQPAFEANLPDVAWFQTKLGHFGYAVPHTGPLDDATRNVIGAFQMKYRNTKFDGVPDAQTAALLDVLTSPAPKVPAMTTVVPVQTK